jgi:hypothetical protein
MLSCMVSDDLPGLWPPRQGCSISEVGAHRVNFSAFIDNVIMRMMIGRGDLQLKF